MINGVRYIPISTWYTGMLIWKEIMLAPTPGDLWFNFPEEIALMYVIVGLFIKYI